jgi:WS/DGAT/MGAT family acyltransferase
VTDRLSATDQAFLAIEDHHLPMHVGALVVLSSGGWVSPDRSLDADAVRAQILAGVASEPRFGARLSHVPGLGHAWTPDPRFDPPTHVSLERLPAPGDDAALMELAGRIFAEPLPRDRPLWQYTMVEGLEGDRFALVLRVHHAMLDGVAGVGALAAMLSMQPTGAPPPRPAPRSSEPPSRIGLAAAMASERAHEIAEAWRDLLQRAKHPRDAASEARSVFRGLLHTLRDGLLPAKKSAINPAHVSPRRGFAGRRLPREGVDRVRRALGGTINDVALAIVTGALRRYLERRGDDLARLHPFRALVPVNLRPHSGRSSPMGNQVALVLAPLPISEVDPRARYDAVRRATAELKHHSHEIEATALIERIADVALPSLVSTIFLTAMRLRSFNVVATNVPGPPFPLYLGPAKLEEIFGLVPLFAHQGLGIVILSYEDGIFFGLVSDREAVPDVDRFRGDVEDAYMELLSLVD